MLKKFLILLLSLCFCFSLGLAIACNPDENDGGDDDVTPPPPAPTQEIIVSDGITFELIPGTYEYKITKYEGSHEVLNVPDTIDGFAVTKVGSLAFNNNSTVMELHFADNIKEFEANSIYRMNKLYTLTLPKNLENMHNNAMLTSIKNQYKSITMPANAITKVWPEKNRTTSYVRITKGDIPDGIFSDKVTNEQGNDIEGSYQAVNVETLILDDEVTSIGKNCFRNMKLLTNLVLSKSLTELPSGSFSHAHELKEVTLHEGLTYIGSAAFSSNFQLREVTLPASLEKLDHAFNKCYSLNRVTIKEGSRLSEVHIYAFEACYQLFEVANLSNLPISLESENYGCLVRYAKHVYNDANETHYSINENGYIIYQDDAMEDYYLMGYVGEERTLNDMPQDIGGNQYKIASFFIYNNTMISEVTIPANVIWIGQNAFTGRYPNSFPLKSITFENNTGWRFTADDEDSGITVDVTNAMNNAEIFVKSYPTYFWKR